MNEIDRALSELKRELRVRSHIYPHLVACDKLSREEAIRRTADLNLAICLIEAQAAHHTYTQDTTVPQMN